MASLLAILQDSRTAALDRIDAIAAEAEAAGATVEAEAERTDAVLAALELSAPEREALTGKVAKLDAAIKAETDRRDAVRAAEPTTPAAPTGVTAGLTRADVEGMDFKTYAARRAEIHAALETGQL